MPSEMELRVAKAMSDAVHDQPYEQLQKVSPVTAAAELRRARAAIEVLRKHQMR